MGNHKASNYGKCHRMAWYDVHRQPWTGGKSYSSDDRTTFREIGLKAEWDFFARLTELDIEVGVQCSKTFPGLTYPVVGVLDAVVNGTAFIEYKSISQAGWSRQQQRQYSLYHNQMLAYMVLSDLPVGYLVVEPRGIPDNPIGIVKFQNVSGTITAMIKDDEIGRWPYSFIERDMIRFFGRGEGSEVYEGPLTGFDSWLTCGGCNYNKICRFRV